MWGDCLSPRTSTLAGCSEPLWFDEHVELNYKQLKECSASVLFPQVVAGMSNNVHTFLCIVLLSGKLISRVLIGPASPLILGAWEPAVLCASASLCLAPLTAKTAKAILCNRFVAGLIE